MYDASIRGHRCCVGTIHAVGFGSTCPHFVRIRRYESRRTQDLRMSERKHSLIRNMFTFGASAATLGFLFLLAVVSARYLGPAEFGIFSFALAFVFFFDFLLDPGLYHLMIREIARNRQEAKQYMIHAFRWKVFIFPFAFIAIAITVHILHEEPRIHQSVYLIAFASFIKSLKDVYRSALLAHERFDLEAISAVIEKGSLLIIGTIVVVAGLGLFGLCWTFVLVRLLDLAIIKLLSRRAFGDSKAKFELPFLTGMLKAGIPIAAYYVTLNVYNYIDTVMISVMRGATEVGWYSASYKVYEGSLLVPIIIGTVMLPRLSRSHGADKKTFETLLAQGWKYSLIFALIVTAVGLPLAADFTNIIYGASYAQSIIALQILLCGAAFAYMVSFLQTVIISIDKQKILVAVALIGLGLNVILNLFAIRRYGYAGAAAVTIFVEAIVFGLLSYQFSKQSPGSSPVIVLLKTTACWAVAAIPVASLLMDAAGFVKAITWGMLFVIFLRISKVIDDSEWDQAVTFFKRLTTHFKS